MNPKETLVLIEPDLRIMSPIEVNGCQLVVCWDWAIFVMLTKPVCVSVLPAWYLRI